MMQVSVVADTSSIIAFIRDLGDGSSPAGLSRQLIILLHVPSRKLIMLLGLLLTQSTLSLIIVYVSDALY